MKRRDFFKAGAGKAARAVVGVLDEKAERRAESWIRPPFARKELDFLLTCTRCDDCVAACPYDVIFKLPAKLGVQVVGTPVLDLAQKGCHLCADWPCVAACEADALRLPEAADEGEGEGEGAIEMPKLALARIDSQACLPYSGPECGACAHVCPIPGALAWQGPKPVIDQALCSGCALCREACITDPKSVLIAAIKRSEEPPGAS